MKPVAILGATGGIGSELAKRLVASKREVVLVGRDREKLERLSQSLGQPLVVAEFASSERLEADLRDALQAGEAYAGLVNCVGSVLLRPAHRTSDEDFRNIVETNLFTAFATIRAAASLLRESGGSVVLFSSAAAQIGIQNHEAIAAAKAGIAGLARSAAATYARQGIRVNVISPGLIRTEMTSAIWKNDAAATASKKMHALGTLGEPGDVASLAEWLLNEENAWVTGQMIGVDGGLGSLLAR